jgi:hypothetical protein
MRLGSLLVLMFVLTACQPDAEAKLAQCRAGFMDFYSHVGEMADYPSSSRNYTRACMHAKGYDIIPHTEAKCLRSEDGDISVDCFEFVASTAPR